MDVACGSSAKTDPPDISHGLWPQIGRGLEFSCDWLDVDFFHVFQNFS